MARVCAIAASALIISAPMANAAEVAIELPMNDRLTLATKTDLAGTGSPDGETVHISAGNGAAATVKITQGRWTVQGLALSIGDNVITARAGTATQSVLVVRGHGVSERPLQKVRFVWNDGVDGRIKDIAKETLDPAPTEAQLEQFVKTVKERTVTLFLERYKGLNIELSDADGADVHTINMLKYSNDLFGSSPSDCGNRNLHQTTSVYVGTYATLMVRELWKPMNRKDTLDTRAEDVGHALGRTSAHELGHSLGLTADTGGACGWMNGCEGWHNCAAYDARQSLANRFDHGWFVMDPGPRTLNQARLSEPNPNKRTSPRVLAKFNTFNRSYLLFIHPTP